MTDLFTILNSSLYTYIQNVLGAFFLISNKLFCSPSEICCSSFPREMYVPHQLHLHLHHLQDSPPVRSADLCIPQVTQHLSISQHALRFFTFSLIDEDFKLLLISMGLQASTGAACFMLNCRNVW